MSGLVLKKLEPAIIVYQVNIQGAAVIIISQGITPYGDGIQTNTRSDGQKPSEVVVLVQFWEVMTPQGRWG